MDTYGVHTNNSYITDVAHITNIYISYSLYTYIYYIYTYIYIDITDIYLLQIQGLPTGAVIPHREWLLSQPLRGAIPHRGITHRSESRSDSGRVSPTRGDTEEDFIITASEVGILRQEYSEFITLKDNAEIVLAEAMEATERLNTVFSRVRASMNRMSPRMKELFIVPVSQASGKTLEPGNNRAHDRAAAQAATQRIIDQTSMIEPAPVSGAEERARTTRSRVPGDRYSRAPLSRNIPEDIPHTARGEQSETHSRDAAVRRIQCMRVTHPKHG